MTDILFRLHYAQRKRASVRPDRNIVVKCTPERLATNRLVR
ncbi:MAG: hypothetical protein ABI567_09655 [Gammaproteobacteria bacterium]